MKLAILSIIVLFAVIFMACNKKTADKAAESKATATIKPVGESKTTAEAKPEMDTKPEVERPSKTPAIYKMVNFKKTPCYGKCPMYEVEIYTDGRATYNGKKFVEKLGLYEAQISEKDLAMMKKKFFDIDFMSLANEYPEDGQKIADLPATIIDFRTGDVIKHVKNQQQAPEKLNKFDAWMVGFIDGLDWKLSSGKTD